MSLKLTLPYPAPLADTVRDVQSHVTERTRLLTGLDVPLPRVGVTALTASAPSPARADLPVPGGLRTPRRWWSRRRVPVALLAWVAAVSCGALAFDLFRVHLADRPAAAWRTGAVHWLSAHGPGDPAVAASDALIALAGAWMILLALAPGRRHQWTVGTPAARVAVAVDRSATAVLVRDAVAAVDGVAAVRVRARRRRLTVRATLAFGDREAARAAVTAAAQDALTASSLHRTPRLRVKVTPAPVWRPPNPAPDPRPLDAPVPAVVSGGDRCWCGPGVSSTGWCSVWWGSGCSVRGSGSPAGIPASRPGCRRGGPSPGGVPSCRTGPGWRGCAVRGGGRRSS
ncbi:DUF6286 domain-containing protein [Streptomyces sp. C1-1]|uniref:DUF6286 domain-containing protein n=1 Tax=Streptomyces sp. C1-1 TaxID=3231173 RepID=UPI003CFD4A24